MPGTDVGIGLLELGASLAGNAKHAGECSASVDFEGSVFTIPNGAYACEVEIDPETGAVEIQRFVGVNDVGRRIDPVIVDGQLHGGVAQGLGQAWLEQVRYEEGSGQLLSGSLMDYALPRADDFPEFEMHEADIPTGNNPIGAKGAGELGCVGAPAAFMNAVADAAGTRGDRHARDPGTGVARAVRDMKVSDLRIDVVRRELPAMALQDGHHPARTVEQGVLRVFTDEGIEGNCLIGAWIPAEPHFRPILDVIKPELVGREPFEREWLWRRMQFLATRFLLSATSWAPVDVALWDIAGKAAGVPVFKLLGRATRYDDPRLRRLPGRIRHRRRLRE